MLPARSAHVVFRLGGQPVELPVEGGGGCRQLGFAVIGGPRITSYLRKAPTDGRTVGVVLRPEACGLLLGVPALDLAHRHTRLEDVWGAAAETARDRLAQAATLEAAVDTLERLLIERLPRARGLHPVVAEALARLPTSPVRDVVRSTGYSHRRVTELFTRATGLSPKRYARVARLEGALRVWEQSPAIRLCDLAQAAGYCDQPHFSREFKELAGMTLGQYRAATGAGSRHVPLPGSALVDFVQDERRGGEPPWAP